MEVSCSFPQCLDQAQQFIVLATHKQPLCDQHFSSVIVSNHSSARVLHIADWESIKRKRDLPSLGEDDVFGALVDLADSIEQTTKEELSHLMNAAVLRMKVHCRRANNLARRLSSDVSAERVDLIQTKSSEIRCLYQQVRFSRALCAYIEQELHTQIELLKDEIRQYALSDSVELSPLASALAASRSFLREFVPCLVDSREGINPELQDGVWTEVSCEYLKKVEVKQEVTKALSFSLMAGPIFAELMAMKKALRSAGNDYQMDSIQSFPVTSKDLCSQIEKLHGTSFLRRKTKEKVSVESFLLGEASHIRIKASALSARNPNDLLDLSDLQTFAIQQNHVGVLAYNSKRFIEAAQLFKIARRVRKRLPECEVDLNVFSTNLSSTYDQLLDFSKATALYRKFISTVRDIDVPSPASIQLASVFCTLLTKANELQEAEIWGRKLLALTKGTVPVINNAVFAALRTLANVMEHRKDFRSTLELRQAGLTLCFQVGAAREPYGEICVELAETKLQLQHFSEAQELLNQAEVALEGKKVKLTQGMLMLALSRLPEARSCLLAAARSASHYVALILLSEIARREEHFAEAWQWLVRANKPELSKLLHLQVQVWTACALISLDTHDLETAEKWLDLALQTYKTKLKELPVSGILLRAIGRLNMEQAKYTEAEEVLKAVLETEKESLGSHMSVGLTHQYLGELFRCKDKFAESEKSLLEALRIQEAVLPHHPEVADSYFSLGQLRYQQQDFEGARDAVCKAINLNEVQRPSHSSLAKSYLLLACIQQQLGFDATLCAEKALAIIEGKPHCDYLASVARSLLPPPASNTS